MSVKHRQAGCRQVARAVAVADHQERIGALKLRCKRRAQGPGGKHASVAEPAPGVDHGQRKILGERGILQAVVHDDDAGAGRQPRPRAPATRSRATMVGATRASSSASSPTSAARIGMGIDELRPGQAAAIAAAQTKHPFAGSCSHFRKPQRGRRLAGPAKREIADAQHRHARALVLPAPFAARRCCRKPAATGASRPQARPALRHQKAGSRIVGSLAQAKLHQIGVERVQRALERAAQAVDRRARGIGDAGARFPVAPSRRRSRR